MMTHEEQVTQLRAGNTLLLEALMNMVKQFFWGAEVLTHSHMSSEEMAIDVLLRAGMAEKIPGGYRLLWDKLEARKAVEQAELRKP